MVTLQAAGHQQAAEAGGREALAERGGDASGDEEVLGEFLAVSHGPPAYVVGALSHGEPAGVVPEALIASISSDVGIRAHQIIDDIVFVGPGGGLTQAGFPRAAPLVGLSASATICRAASSTSPGGTSTAAESTSSSIPPTRVLTSGTPASSASWATNARASQVEVNSARSAAASNEPMSSLRPGKETCRRSFGDAAL